MAAALYFQAVSPAQRLPEKPNPNRKTPMDKLRLALLPLLLLPAVCRADDDDDSRRRLLEEGGRQMRQYRDSSWLGDAAPAEAQVQENDGYISISGQIYQVGGSKEELETALYYALNLRQWHKVRQFAARYAALPGHKPALLHLAEGLQAREQGKLVQAVRLLKTAAEEDPANARIALELGRAYTEDNQNREAAAQFSRVFDSGIPEETKAVVARYLEEIGKRSRWHGQISLGYGYNSNINQANGSTECVWQIGGMCMMERQLPQAVSSPLANFSASAAKTLPLSGHHGLHLRGLAYGTHYRHKDPQSSIQPDYSYYNGTLSAGYDYADARSHFSLLPYFEYDFRNGHTQYRAWGADTDWSRAITPRWRINARAGAKRYHYSGSSKTYYADYSQYELGAGAEFSLTPSAGLFANLDATRRKYPSDVSSSYEYAARLGAYKLFGNGIYLNGLLLHRRSLYDAAGFLSDGERRQDKQAVAIVAAGWRRPKGITPELRFRRTVARSNSVYYRYRQNEVLLSLRYQF